MRPEALGLHDFETAHVGHNPLHKDGLQMLPLPCSSHTTPIRFRARNIAGAVWKLPTSKLPSWLKPQVGLVGLKFMLPAVMHLSLRLGVAVSYIDGPRSGSLVFRK